MINVNSPTVQTAVVMVTPFAVAVGIFLFFAGHNQPGGGFAAGLVFGAVVALRVLVGLQQPRYSLSLLAAGGAITAAVALLPMLGGEPLLDQFIVEGKWPVLGKVKTGSAALFDLGVTLIVVGVVIAVLDSVEAEELSEEGAS